MQEIEQLNGKLKEDLKMKKYQISYSHAYGIDHFNVYANNKKEARKIFNSNKPIAGSKIIEIEEI